ncbi:MULTISPECIES: exonuclease [unclassified Thioalkalivibrio]|uniref:exonuclease n=1 Tax=unclassified Thioalkalivibrio TaxID=2621013 RepID=UPI000375C4E0|nr:MULTISPECIES: exonuclease [unclassified Thioalkalivibrio]
MGRLALIDGDIYAYEVAAGAEESINWGDGLWTLHSWEEPAIAHLEYRIRSLVEAVEADDYMVILSDSNNWRNGVLPTYKQNRVGQRKPLLLNTLKEYLREKHKARIEPGLEADDLLGIMATSNLTKQPVVITKDKDLQTVPGLHFLSHKPERGIFEVTQEEADNWHLIQALAGDVTDGYTGCPGIGVETAREIVETCMGVYPYDHTFKSGPRKGTTEIRFKKEECSDPWTAILTHYKKAGLGVEFALTQARVARILRSGEYNFETKEVNLWKPSA